MQKRFKKYDKYVEAEYSDDGGPLPSNTIGREVVSNRKRIERPFPNNTIGQEVLYNRKKIEARKHHLSEVVSNVSTDRKHKKNKEKNDKDKKKSIITLQDSDEDRGLLISHKTTEDKQWQY